MGLTKLKEVLMNWILVSQSVSFTKEKDENFVSLVCCIRNHRWVESPVTTWMKLEWALMDGR